MRFDPFDPWGLWPDAWAREQRRRQRIGKLGRIKEDFPGAAFAIFLLLAYLAVTLLPWCIGVFTIGAWIFGAPR